MKINVPLFRSVYLWKLTKALPVMLLALPASAGQFSGAGASGGGGEWPPPREILDARDLNERCHC